MNSRGLRFTTFHVGPAEAIPPDTKPNTIVICALRASASDADIAIRKKMRKQHLKSGVGGARSDRGR